MEQEQNVFSERKISFLEWLHNYQNKHEFDLRL